MTLEEKLRRLKEVSTRPKAELDLERALEYLRRANPPARKPAQAGKLPAQRAPKGVEEYVEGNIVRNTWGEFFLAEQSLPFGRPYGRIRIGDLAHADLSPLTLFFGNGSLPGPEKIVYLDTETTGLAGGTGTCAFLIGIGAAEGSSFVVRQFFLRDYPDEKAALAALADGLGPYEVLVTFNGKTFDIPLLETRFALARMKSPFARFLHLDALHPARRLWRLRLESCELTNLERHVLGISREGDVPGAEIPGIYFDYLRTGDASGLQPVFYHNALDILTLAALTLELARMPADATADRAVPGLDLFSLSRIFDRAGAFEESMRTCRQALSTGLPQSVEARALKQLASQHKRQRKYELAVEFWVELTRRDPEFALDACEELAIYYEHRERNLSAALAFTEAALERLRESSSRGADLGRFTHRLARLRKKTAKAT